MAKFYDSSIVCHSVALFLPQSTPLLRGNIWSIKMMETLFTPRLYFEATLFQGLIVKKNHIYVSGTFDGIWQYLPILGNKTFSLVEKNHWSINIEIYNFKQILGTDLFFFFKKSRYKMNTNSNCKTKIL